MEAKTKADEEAQKYVKKNIQTNYLGQLDEVKNVREHEKKMSEL
jgi:hypothetical protein